MRFTKVNVLQCDFFAGPRQGSTLEILRLRSCWELTNHGVLNIVHSLPALTDLSLSGCTKITDDGVELLAENLRNLRVLDLSWSVVEDTKNSVVCYLICMYLHI